MAATITVDRRTTSGPPAMISGYAALAESAWMGAAQATDVLEPVNIVRRRLQPVWPRLPHLQLRGLLHREFSIAEASFVLMSSFLLSAALGAIRQILFNAQFGAGFQASAYYAAFRLPDTLFSLIAGGALSSAMIPVLLSARKNDGNLAEEQLLNLVLNSLLALFVLIVIVGELAAPVFVSHVLAPGFDTRTSTLTVSLTRLMLIQPLILVAGSVVIALLNSRNQFLLTAASVASHNLGLIGGILATRLHPALGIYGPAWGVIAGAVLQVLILLPGVLANDLRFHVAWNPRDRHLREVIALLIPNGLAVGVLYAGFILDTAFASKSGQIDALPAIQNAFLLIGLPIALLGQAVGQSSFPRLAEQAATRQWQELRRTVLRALAAVVIIAVPATLFMMVAGRRVIHVLFEHGQYGTHAGSLTYDVLVSYAIALPAYVATEVLTRGLIALRDTRTPLLTNTLQIAGRAGLMVILLGSVGVLAVPRAFAVMACVETLILAGVLTLRLRGLVSRPAAAAAAPST
jgi:putative peptidoglycan lipid II flippase